MSFLVKKKLFVSKTKINFGKILFFAIPGPINIWNECYKFQNDLINIQGDITYPIRKSLCGKETIPKNDIPIGYNLKMSYLLKY